MNSSVEVFEQHISTSKRLHVEQVLEGFEIILGWETRNKYRILDENREPLAYAAEQSKGILSSLFRQILGHWKAFDVTIFNENRQAVYHLEFPFRWFFKTLYLRNANGKPLGHLQQRFAIFRKKFDLYNEQGRIVARINSSFFRFWTFEFKFGPRKLGVIQKKWAGALSEFFTDKDNFIVSYTDSKLDPETKALMLATCLMVDIVYFENNQKKLDLLDFT